VSSALDLRRRERRRPELVPLTELPDDIGAESPEWLDGAALVSALGELPENHRVPTVLRDVYGLPYQEIADVTGRPLGTVKAMVHRGRARLRLRLRAHGLGPESHGETSGE
jgi:DNA-directed RNA polymerase specialized sigma24 family protein